MDFLRISRTPRVSLESPYAGNIARNTTYLLLALRDSIDRGEAPFASHAIYPLILDDDDPTARHLGITLGYTYLIASDLVAFYIDLGWSAGMLQARDFALEYEIPFEEREICLAELINK